jgi:hypothetical protein
MKGVELYVQVRRAEYVEGARQLGASGSIPEGGDAVKRFVIGFGSGSSMLDKMVEGYVMTPQGLPSLGSGNGYVLRGKNARDGGSGRNGNCYSQSDRAYRRRWSENLSRGKRPNSLGARAKETADEIAEQLKVRFQERGWLTTQATEEAELTWKSVGSGVGAARK